MTLGNSPGTLPALFASQARRTPDGVAVVRSGRSLTYAELAAASDRVAAGVAGRGAGPGDIVGLCMHRSPAMLAAVLGILKAGAAYLPIDPVFPAERLSYMMMDSGAALVLADDDLAERLPAGVPVMTPLTMESGGQPESPAPGDVAYVIYTSGSTGRPKGVAVEHRAVAGLLNWAVSYFTRAELSRVLLSTTLSFDISVFELFAPLMAGGTIVIARDLLELPDLPEAHSLTLINTVPSILEQLVTGPGIPPGLPVVSLVGEPLPRQLARRLYDRFGVSRVVNLYGPTETTIYSTAYTVPPDEEGPVPIGWPLPGETAYVVEPGGPADTEAHEGELCLAGIGLARGYLGRPALTAERFVPAINGEAGGRMYRTGDLVRRRPDGCLEILGRFDEQVKIRGFRVELGEVETVLGQFPGIAQLRAAVRVDPTGRKRLVAYACVEDPQQPVSLHALRRYGAVLLPDYMLPTDLVILEKMPLLANGKIDRAALPPLATDRPEQWAERRDVYDTVLSAWQSVLARPTIDPDDDFFDIGGDSLTSVMAIWKLRADLHMEIPLTAIYESRTARRLSKWIGERAGTSPQQPAGS